MEAICNGFLKPLPIKWLNSKNCIQAKTRKDACGAVSFYLQEYLFKL